MKNKGYTLLELLGVIVILSVLVILVFPSVINFIKKGNDKIDSITNDLIMSAAEDYINDNSSELYITSGGRYCISIETLVGKKYLNESLIDKDLYVSKSIKVTYTDKYNYEITAKDECSVCKLVKDSDSSNTITPGDKYQCKVKDDMEEGFENGYYFYVLSQETGTTNLIMDRNIYYDSTNEVGLAATETNTGHTAWISSDDYNDNTNYGSCGNNNKGPITAMNYLYNATKDWLYIPNVLINYTDEGNSGSYGYGAITTTNNLTQITQKDGTLVTVLTDQEGYINLKARMPYKNEVDNYDGTNGYLYDNLHSPTCYNEFEDENGDIIQEVVACSENYDDVSGVDEVGVDHIDGIYDYWTFSSGYESHTAWYVSDLGLIYHFGNISGNTHYSSPDGEILGYQGGVRPVITISNSLISN